MNLANFYDQKKTLLLTGGSQGIGRATVEYFLEQNWRVAFVARNPDGIQECLEYLNTKGYGPDVLCGVPLDVSDLDAVETFPASCAFLADGLDALVLNAFYQKIKPAQEFDRHELENHWMVNNLSPILLIKACFEMLKKSQGSVVYVSSIMDERAAPGYAAYGASKAYMKAFIRQAALDYGPQGVRINAVSPGAIRTEALERAIEAEGEDGRAKANEILKQIPLENRWGEAMEVAETIWFAVTGPRYLHGRDLRINGGLV